MQPHNDESMRYGRPTTLAAVIAGLVQARQNCTARGNTEWQLKHGATLNWIADNLLPSGSGIDSGTAIDWNKSTGDKIVLSVPFHHMDANGGYAGWTSHTITVRPSFTGVSLTISGHDRDGIKDYLYDTFDYVLTRTVRAKHDADNEETTYEWVG